MFKEFIFPVKNPTPGPSPKREGGEKIIYDWTIFDS